MKHRIPILLILALLGCVARGQTYTWTNAAGGSWNTASNWNTNPDLPVFGADVVVDFSTKNLTANRDLNLGSTGKIVGKILFGDSATPSYQWDIVAQNGPLTLSTTTGKPVVEVVNSTSVLTVNVVGTQGFEKTGSAILRLNNTANAITGEILVSNGTLQIRDGSTNTPTAFAAATMADRSLKVTGTGIIDLLRLDASGTQNITWTLPSTSVANGGTLRFRNNNGSTYNHTMNAAIIAGSGGGTIASTGGTGVQSITLGGALSGSGALAYSVSAGTTRQLTVSSSNNTYSGNWTVSHTGAGTAILRAGAAGALGTGTVTINTNGTLLNGVDGSLNSLAGVTLLQASSVLDLAGQSWQNPAASLTVTNGIVQIGGGLLSVGTLAMSGGEIQVTASSGATAPVVAAGNANFGGRTMTVTLSGSPVGGTFELVRYGGTLSQPPAVIVSGDTGRLASVVDIGDGTDDRIKLSFTGSVADLVWTGANSNVWDNNTTVNFHNGVVPDVFRSFDNVTFNDTSSVTAVSLPVSLNVSSVLFHNNTTAYTLNGAGGLAGPASLSKSGGGTLTLNTPNTFFGSVTVNGGRLVIGNAAALGAAGTKTVTVGTDAQLDFNGVAPGTARGYTYRIQGTGDGTGALTNSSATAINENSGVLNLELLGNASVGGAGRFDIGRTGATTGGILGNGHTLTKTGANTIFLRGPAQNVSFVVAQGTLGIQDNDLVVGGAGGNVTVKTDAILNVYDARSIATPLRLEDKAQLTCSGSGGSDWSGPITLAGTGVINVPTAPLVVSGSIGEDGDSFVLRKEGGNLLTLSGDNSHSGGTLVLGGQVNVTSDTAFGTGPVTVDRDDPGGAAVRINLANVTIDNDFLLNSNAGTVSRGLVSTAAGNTLSVVAGDITLARSPANGGTFSAFDGGILRVLGAIRSTNGINPFARSGIIEIGGGQGDYTVFGHGEGTLRLVSDNGLVPTARLVSAVNGACTFDLNGHNQTLAGLSRQTTSASVVTNNSMTPSVLAVEASVATTFAGIIESGSGGVSIEKSGPETWTLAGDNTYTGTTTVLQGTLRIDGNQRTATGAITVSGAESVLAGGGQAGGAITVGNGGTLAPGGGATGILTAAAPVSLGAGTVFRARIDSSALTATRLACESGLTIEAGVALDVQDLASIPAALPVGTILVLIDYGPTVPIQGNFDGLPEGALLTAGVNGFTISYTDANRVTLVAAGVQDPYFNWAANPAFALIPGVNDGFAQDADNDGLVNGMEWVLGGNPSFQDAAFLVSATRPPGGGLILNFTREPSSMLSVDLLAQYNTDLSATWSSVVVGASDSGPDADGVTVHIDDSSSPHRVTVEIPSANEEAGKLFSRLALQPK